MATAPSDRLSHSIEHKGGYKEINHQNDFPSIQCFENSASAYTGFTLSDDIWSSGRRRVGMLVFIMKSQQFYNLIPVGFVGNGGDLIISDWMALPEWERALRIAPSGTYCSEGATPANGFSAVQKTAADIGISADPMGCWIETAIGIDGTSGIDGDPGIAGPMGTVAKILDFATEGFLYKVGPDSYWESANNNSNPDLYLVKGETYIFRRSTAGHPLSIASISATAVGVMALVEMIVLEPPNDQHTLLSVPSKCLGRMPTRPTNHRDMTVYPSFKIILSRTYLKAYQTLLLLLIFTRFGSD